MAFDTHPLVRVSARGGHGLDTDRYPASIPAVAQLLAEGLDFSPGVTFLVGENGSGKSTLVEAIAIAYGLSPEGGTTSATHSTRSSESGLAEALTLQRGLGSQRSNGFFLRAETMHGWFSWIESLPGGSHADYHSMSHGQSFNALIDWAINPRFPQGLLVLDEPEAALSFSSTLRLIGVLRQATELGNQVICATHSPVLASSPGAEILEIGDWGIRHTAWQDLELVEHWRRYLDAPDRYLRHLLD
ncbi:AAA family ATPase [Naumannella halotolerans]|uniref:AAA family ATPase n=1 Tax=Naumannella halotolerans TaxID=993414 RepID=UPI00370DCB31